MNIAIAAHYMNIGYRVRRTSWEPEEYLAELAGMFQKQEVHYSNVWNKESCGRILYKSKYDLRNN